MIHSAELRTILTILPVFDLQYDICLSQASPNNNNKKKQHYHLLQYNTNAFDRLPVVSIEPNSLLIAAAAVY